MDPMLFRQTVGQFVTGITVIATESDGLLHAMTASSFTSLSLHPPLVLFCVDKAAKMGQLIQGATGFSINILRRDQEDISRYFAGAWRQSKPPAYSFTGWEGVPRLEGSAAALACSLHAVQEGGDHRIVIGRVRAAHRAEDGGLPLVFFGGRYVSLEEAIASS